MLTEVSTEKETDKLSFQMNDPDKKWEFPRTRSSTLKVGAFISMLNKRNCKLSNVAQAEVGEDGIGSARNKARK